MLESIVSKFREEKSKFIGKILSFRVILCVIDNFHKFLPFSRRPPGIQNQIPFEQAIFDAVSDKAVTQETQFRLMGRSVPLRQQLLYFQPVLFLIIAVW